MQYYLNGFKPGDPRIVAAAPKQIKGVGADGIREVDVLIVGCGPAGLTLAAQLSAFPEIDTMIVERGPGPIEKGRADGINVRSMEMFQAFGFAGKAKEEAYWANETAFWVPDPDKPGNIIRNGSAEDVEDDLSEMPHTLMSQARVHELYLEVMRNSASRLEPDYSLQVRDLTVDTTADTHPVTVVLERTDPENEGQEVTVRANYVVGCDGARSAVREAIGGELRGISANQAWGVMDLLATTDFPDIRMKCMIQSTSHGNIAVLPREGGYMFRLYVEMDKLKPGERAADRDVTLDQIVAKANKILHPYSIDVKEAVWWSIYEVGHRMTNKFDDVPEQETATRNPRVFVAGDACHTHSPRGGQGMNVSMGDTFNLGWKLVQVLKGRSDPSLLRTYSAERWNEAKRLVDTNRDWTRITSEAEKNPELKTKKVPVFQEQFHANRTFTAGLAVCYEPSQLIGDATYQGLATGQPIGKRFHSAPVVRLADAKPMQLGHVAQADACWRIYAFAAMGDAGQPGSGIHNLSEFLENDPNSPVVKYTRPDEDIDAVIDFRAVFQQGYRDLSHDKMPSLLKPAKGAYGLCDYEKVFCADLKSGNDIFEMRGIDREKGCAVIVRPDQYVANVLPLDAHDELRAFFDGFLLPAS
ncbi:FAD-dependent monooxygenase [Hoeflea alexandrii]|uniref:FAD-dependent monooxygenase n=1 Tax=Hoeflea alexandrii TaxID=288436 RepID=UPI0022B00355|nr:FAD-dependent monooxygenase [Hoeflea alexandrii]MCZ4291582.1 FAD-dependent monooxygenase [Hoeflea alexandrii]